MSYITSFARVIGFLATLVAGLVFLFKKEVQYNTKMAIHGLEVEAKANDGGYEGDPIMEYAMDRIFKEHNEEMKFWEEIDMYVFVVYFSTLAIRLVGWIIAKISKR